MSLEALRFGHVTEWSRRFAANARVLRPLAPHAELPRSPEHRASSAASFRRSGAPRTTHNTLVLAPLPKRPVPGLLRVAAPGVASLQRAMPRQRPLRSAAPTPRAFAPAIAAQPSPVTEARAPRDARVRYEPRVLLPLLRPRPSQRHHPFAHLRSRVDFRR